MIFTCIREVFAPDHTLGVVTYKGEHFGYTVEDTDRYLETGGVKVPKLTAIPRGTYRLILSKSPRFGRVTPELVEVPDFTGVRVHGGNYADDTEGCPILGAERIPKGVRNCAKINAKLMSLIADSKVPCYWEIM